MKHRAALPLLSICLAVALIGIAGLVYPMFQDHKLNALFGRILTAESNGLPMAVSAKLGDSKSLEKLGSLSSKKKWPVCMVIEFDDLPATKAQYSKLRVYDRSKEPARLLGVKEFALVNSQGVDLYGYDLGPQDETAVTSISIESIELERRKTKVSFLPCQGAYAKDLVVGDILRRENEWIRLPILRAAFWGAVFCSIAAYLAWKRP
jgi:hypothetical protein